MTPPDPAASTSLRLIGYCSLGEAAIAAMIDRGDLDGLRDLPGEYTIVATRGDDCTIITSPVGAMHYFFHHTAAGFWHGDTVGAVVQQARLPWRWDWQALADFSLLENLTGNHSLHPEVRRVPPGTVLRLRGGRLDLQTRVHLDELSADARPAGSDRQRADAAIAALNREVATWAGERPYLSLSGGFDSRLILASMLSQGIRPHLITMGEEGCSDVSVARRIATHFGLSHDLIRIDLNDFLSHAPEIARITSGSMMAWHWHTYLYPLKAAIPEGSTFFVGTLGEFARSYYFDRGKLGLLANRFADSALRRFWTMKLARHPSLPPAELEGVAAGLRQQLEPQAMADRSQRLAGYGQHRFLQGLTRYYFEQRVPNFYANGIRMYNASSQWRSPFHSRDWIRQIWSLGEGWKLGSNWHRHAIGQLVPELLNFQEENGAARGRMLAKAPPLYWTPLMRRTPYISYDLSPDWYRQEPVAQLLRERLGSIADVIDPQLGLRILEQHRRGEDRTRSLAFLLTLIFARPGLGGGA